MINDTGRLNDLLTKFVSDKASEQEVRELFTLLKESNDESPVKLQAERLWNEYHKDDSLTDTDWEKIYAKIVATPVIGHRTQKRYNIFKIAAAAAIVTGLLVGAYFLFFSESNNNNKNTIVQQPVVPVDLPPGKDGAVLILADGRQIILDSANNGKISEAAIKNGSLLSYENAANAEVGYNTMTTPKGRQYSLLLADGSRVWLNAASSITFPTTFTGNERKVEITGEAYFEVAHNAGKPFTVSVNGMDVQVLGTHFNINAYNDEATIKTTLLQGSVKVSYRKDPSTSLRTQLLAPGQQVQLNDTGEMALIKNANTEEAMAWRNNRFSFINADLKTILRQVARWYDVDVAFETTVPTVQFSGEIGRQLTLQQFLSVLDETRIHYRIEGKKLIIIP